MIRVRSALWRALAKARWGGRITFGPGAILLRPALLRIEGNGRIHIGDGAAVEAGARLIARGAALVLEDRAYLGAGTTVVAFADVTIGSATLLGERVSIHSEDHGPADARQRFSTAPVVIGRGCWLGAGVVVTKGCTVGDGTTVGANAVVTRDLPAHVLAVGAPARPIRRLG